MVNLETRLKLQGYGVAAFGAVLYTLGLADLFESHSINHHIGFLGGGLVGGGVAYANFLNIMEEYFPQISEYIKTKQESKNI